MMRDRCLSILGWMGDSWALGDVEELAFAYLVLAR